MTCLLMVSGYKAHLERLLRVARAVQTGRMWVNTYHELPAHAPFGGL